MTEKKTRMSVDGILARISAACGMALFLDTLTSEAMSAATLNILRMKLPYRLSVNKLALLLDLVYPGLRDLYEINPSADRLAAIRRFLIGDMARFAQDRHERSFAVSLHDPDHLLFRHCTDETYSRYARQKGAAKALGAEWRFDFLTWIRWWMATGLIDERGIESGYEMSRKNDDAPFSPANCIAVKSRARNNPST